jgi:transposase
MPTIKHAIHLSSEERAFLEKHIKTGSWKPREVIRARILLLADVDGPDGLTDKEIAKQLNCSLASVFNRRKLFSVSGSIEDCLFDKPRSGRPTIVDGAVDAHMTAIACSTAPEGRAKWTLRLIKDRIVSLEVIDSISHSTVRRSLKKKKLNLG